ncbi:21817_t:CDS:1, partial [Dentiscutata erythropus]
PLISILKLINEFLCSNNYTVDNEKKNSESDKENINSEMTSEMTSGMKSKYELNL